MEDPDPRTIRAAADGDVDAFAMIVRQYEQPVWRFVCRLVGDRTLAEDLTQEAFLRAYRSLDTFRFQSRFSTWLFRIARNAAIDALRRRERRRGMLDRLRLLERPAPEPAHLGPEIDEALATLTPALREALVVIEVLGFTYREAGEVLDVPAGTVKSRAYHARRRLADWFATDQERADEM